MSKSKLVVFLNNHKRDLYWVLPVLLFCFIMVASSWHVPMWMDEYIFYRLSSGLPNYSATSDWLFKDRPSTINPMDTWNDKTDLPLDRNASLHWVYDNKVYGHGPLAPVLCWPIVKTLNTMADKGWIAHIEDQLGYPVVSSNITDIDMQKLNSTMNAETITKILRFIPILLFAISMWLIYKIMYRKVGSSAAVFAIPVTTGIQLLSGVYLFYWDVWMMFFLVLTLYLMERKSKWAYLTACCMVNTKLFVGLIFLLPLVVKNWKMVFTGLSLVPFYLAIAYVNGDIWYPLIHYGTGAGMNLHNYVYHLYDLKGYGLLIVSLGIPFFLAMTIPIFWRIKKYPEYVVLLIAANLYAWGSGLGMTHLSSLVYVGALIFPLVFCEFNLYPKFYKIFSFFNFNKGASKD